MIPDKKWNQHDTVRELDLPFSLEMAREIFSRSLNQKIVAPRKHFWDIPLELEGTTKYNEMKMTLTLNRGNRREYTNRIYGNLAEAGGERKLRVVIRHTVEVRNFSPLFIPLGAAAIIGGLSTLIVSAVFFSAFIGIFEFADIRDGAKRATVLLQSIIDNASFVSD